MIKNKNSYVIFDFTGEYTGQKRGCRKLAGKIIKTLPDLIQSNSKKLIFAPENIFELNRLIDSILYFRNTIVVIDEAQTISKAGYLPLALKNLVMVGRHRNLFYIVASRRPAEIARDFTSQVDKLYFFRLTEPNDLKYVANYYNPDEIKNLTGHNYIKLDI